MSQDFFKIADLSAADRGKLKSYWKELWGKEFANALVEDYAPQGNNKKIVAGIEEVMIKGAQFDPPGGGMGEVTIPPATPENSPTNETSNLMAQFSLLVRQLKDLIPKLENYVPKDKINQELQPLFAEIEKRFKKTAGK